MCSNNCEQVSKSIRDFIDKNADFIGKSREFVKEQKRKTSIIWEESKKLYRYLANVKIMIVTANQIECETLTAFFAENSGYDLVKIGKGKVVYTFFKINDCKVVHIEPTNIGAYTKGGTAETIREALKIAKPNAVLSLGVGFGADYTKSDLGDVMIGRQHFSYDKSAKVVKDGIEIKVLHVEEPDNYMLSRFKSNINAEEPMKGTLLKNAFAVLMGNMVTGEFVIDSKEFMNMILKPFELFGIIGGEMEAYGIFEEIKLCKNGKKSKGMSHCIMIKGICDWGNGKNSVKSESHPDIGKNDLQRYAMMNACEVCKQFLNSNEMFSDLKIMGVRKKIWSWLSNRGIKGKKLRVTF